ncbi:MAG: aminotransferase class IV family protein, partial [Deltaproteobacteria bacterium]|nr:aminotransferase class IV family protein [Deltaproteobacteria bacterium]
PCRVIIVTELPRVPEEFYKTGVRVCVIEVGRSSAGELPQGAKSGNYLTNLLALREAKRRGAHEALLVDPRGRICEGSSSNVFAVIGGTIRTPPLDVGILEGITRRKVMSLAQGLGHRVEEVELSREDLASADEIFITSTIREVLPVTELGEVKVAGGRPGAITRSLRLAFRDLTRLI